VGGLRPVGETAQLRGIKGPSACGLQLMSLEFPSKGNVMALFRVLLLFGIVAAGSGLELSSRHSG